MAGAGRDLYEQGLVREKAGDIPGAFEAFRGSAKLDPRVAAPFVGLSRVLLRNHQRKDAIACLKRAIACEPLNPALHTLLGKALSRDGQLARARESFDRALRLQPESVDANLGVAALFEDLGQRPEAAGAYRDLLDRVPGTAEAVAGLLGVVEGEALDEAIRSAEPHLAAADDGNAAQVGYALGKALAGRGDHDAAFEAWSKANAARRRAAGAFDRHQFDRRIDRLTELFSADFFAARRGWGEPSTPPVFLVGLPRSGTTLTEQVLAGHPGVFGAGELDLLTDMATGTPGRVGRPDLSWPETAPELTRAITLQIARDHLDRLSALADVSPQASRQELPRLLRIIDKQPLNFWHLGLIALMFPNAPIIHCKRDMRDNGLSIFAENFTPEQRWATDLADIGYYWRGYRRLMEHWSAVTGLRVIDVDYEATVSDLERQARRLTQFLDLPWDPAVLDFHTAERAVQTPSRWQVRRPLYGSAMGRWRHYEKHLGPLNETLG